MSELFGLAGHNGEGRRGESLELQNHIDWVAGKMILVLQLFRKVG